MVPVKAAYHAHPNQFVPVISLKRLTWGFAAHSLAV